MAKSLEVYCFESFTTNLLNLGYHQGQSIAHSLEHILLRPDTYIGSVEFCNKTLMWVYDQEEDKLVQREISYVPGLYKIFDEILVNAADNKQRDEKMNLIRVNINKEKNEISILNNGKGHSRGHAQDRENVRARNDLRHSAHIFQLQ
uniref:DNA topoisomerase (ATP-hydrolyzing) n=1 Tax=Ditylenchus dipsaci TaxID=166011 RepID=A0A915DLS8_9BILA